MRATLEYQKAIQDIKQEVLTLTVLVDDEMEQAFFDIGAILKLQVENSLPRSDKSVDVRKSTRKKHIHLKDDVKYWVGKSKRTGNRYVSVYGGKDTGYKWGWVNDGHVFKRSRKQTSGQFVPGIHFLEKALSRAEGMIDSTINEYLEEAVKKDA